MGWFSNKFDFKSEEDIEKLVKKHGALAVILPDGSYARLSHQYCVTSLTKSKSPEINLTNYIGIKDIKILGKIDKFFETKIHIETTQVVAKVKVYDIEIYFKSGTVLKGTISDEVGKYPSGDEYVKLVANQMKDSNGYVIFDENGAEATIKVSAGQYDNYGMYREIKGAEIDYTKLREVDEYDVELDRVNFITEFILKPAKL